MGKAAASLRRLSTHSLACSVEVMPRRGGASGVPGPNSYMGTRVWSELPALTRYSAWLQVDPSRFPPLGEWARGSTMEAVLTELRRELAAPHNRRLPQPVEWSTY